MTHYHPVRYMGIYQNISHKMMVVPRCFYIQIECYDIIWNICLRYAWNIKIAINFFWQHDWISAKIMLFFWTIKLSNNLNVNKYNLIRVVSIKYVLLPAYPHSEQYMLRGPEWGCFRLHTCILGVHIFLCTTFPYNNVCKL